MAPSRPPSGAVATRQQLTCGFTPIQERKIRGLPRHLPINFPCLRGHEPISSCSSHLASPPAMRAVLDIVLIVLDLYVWLLIASAILSWLIAFNVVNTRNQFVGAVSEFLYRITEPVLAPIRRMMPSFGGLDISPIILILIIMFIQRVISYYIYPNVI